MTGASSAIENKPIDITVLVTCYNEAAFITDTLDNVTAALQEVGRSYEIIVVDDASKDDSVQRIREYLQRRPACPITLKVNERNRGLGNNYVEAAFLGQGKYYRLCCGDNPESKEMLVRVFTQIGRADMILPYQRQKDVAGKSSARKLLSDVFTFLVNLINGYQIKYYNGLAVHLRYNVMRWHPTSYGFGFQADIITRLLDEGASYLQVPWSSVDREKHGSGALSVRNILSVGHTLLELAIRRLRRFLYGRQSPKPLEIALESKVGRLDS